MSNLREKRTAHWRRRTSRAIAKNKKKIADMRYAVLDRMRSVKNVRVKFEQMKKLNQLLKHKAGKTIR